MMARGKIERINEEKKRDEEKMKETLGLAPCFQDANLPNTAASWRGLAREPPKSKPGFMTCYDELYLNQRWD